MSKKQIFRVNPGALSLVLALALTTLIWQTANAQVTDSSSFEKQRLPPKAQRDMRVSGERVEAFRAYASTKYEMYNVQFSDWDQNDLHWNSPSNMSFQSDGTFFIYAKHLSNMRRTGGFFDTGDLMTALVNVTFFDGPVNAQQQCTGSVIHSRDYTLRSVDYKVDVWDVTATGVDDKVRDVVASRGKCASFVRWWR